MADGKNTGRITTPLPVLRLYLIRHSETEANLAGVVLGQSDSVSECVSQKA